MEDNGLDERKTKILNAIIKNYLETGEPVGSRTISKYTDLNLSSATIRNEMSDLEELGYILQPHTSAGRIPSDKGYRFYVDHLMEEKDRIFSLEEDYGVPVSFQIENHKIRFVQVTCPDHICENAGLLSMEGQSAVCMPNRTSLSIYGEEG